MGIQQSVLVAQVKLPEPSDFIGDIYESYAGEMAVYVAAVASVSLGFLLIRSLAGR